MATVLARKSRCVGPLQVIPTSYYTAATFHDREWRRTEGRRVGSDWRVLLALHTAAVPPHDPDYTSAPMTVCPTCGAAPCVNPSFCAACRDADRRRTRAEQSRHIDTIPRDWESMSVNALWQLFNKQRPTPQVTIEALWFCICERGPAALLEPGNMERIRTLDDAARAELERRISTIKNIDSENAPKTDF